MRCGGCARRWRVAVGRGGVGWGGGGAIAESVAAEALSDRPSVSRRRDAVRVSRRRDVTVSRCDRPSLSLYTLTVRVLCVFVTRECGARACGRARRGRAERRRDPARRERDGTCRRDEK